MTAWWAPTLMVVGVFGGALLCLPLTRRMPWPWLLATALYLAADVEVLVLAPRVHALHWNWVGKAGSIVLGLVAMRVFRLSRAEVGLQLPRRGTWWWVVAGLVGEIALSAAGSRGLYRQPTDWETLLYQATMPGVAEELVYRGVAFALLLRGFGDGAEKAPALAAVVIPSCCFGLAHVEPLVRVPHEFLSLFVSASALQFGSKFLFGVLLGAVRWRTRSLLGPVLAHNAADVVGTATAGRV